MPLFSFDIFTRLYVDESHPLSWKWSPEPQQSWAPMDDGAITSTGHSDFQTGKLPLQAQPRPRECPGWSSQASSTQCAEQRPQIEGASGSLSTTYLPLPTLIMGTPGIFRSLLLRSRSFVATM